MGRVQDCSVKSSAIASSLTEEELRYVHVSSESPSASASASIFVALRPEEQNVMLLKSSRPLLCLGPEDHQPDLRAGRYSQTFSHG